MKHTKDSPGSHGPKYIAPAVIAALLLVYYIGFAAVCVWLPELPFPARVALAIVPLLLAGVVIYVLLQRIGEIRDGEEDDLDQY